MKKNFKPYALIWAIFLIAFNVIVFLIQPIIPKYTVKYDATFWTAWAFIIVAFIGNLVCANEAFKAENLKKLFYNIPLITISRSALITILIMGSGLMIIPNCPAWVAAVICIIILTFNAVAVVKASWTIDVVETVDEKIKSNTSFIKMLTVDAETLISKAKNEEFKTLTKKVYEAVRYSDPMSNTKLADIEKQIESEFLLFAKAVKSDNMSLADSSSENLISLIDERNKKCRVLK